MIIDSKTDLTGMKFGKWTVLSKAPSKNNRKSWNCRCDCGTERIINGRDLYGNRSKSCGKCCDKTNVIKSILKDETGKIYGRLTVLQRSPENKRNRAAWICKCQCGNIVTVCGDDLRSGGTKSCGCLRNEKQSYGSQQIERLLKENNIKFEQEKTFSDCHFPNSNALFRFDFYVNDRYIIEFDGQQHFFITGWGSKEEKEKQFEITKLRDDFKNNWCWNNNIPIIRIPYTHTNFLKIEDLIPELSSFTLKKEEE